MAALPYMQFYVADYLADTLYLDVIESGAYLHLIFNYWQTGKPLPNDDRKLARIAKCTEEQWFNVRSTVVDYFVEQDEVLIHNRVEHDLEKVREKAEQASRAGKKSAESRAKNKKMNKKSTSVSNERSTTVESVLQRNVNHTDTDTDTDTEGDNARARDPAPPVDNSVPDLSDLPPHVDDKRMADEEVIALFNEIFSAVIREPAKVTMPRLISIQMFRTDGLDSINAWREYFERVEKSDFLTGRKAPKAGGEPFVLNISWLLKPENWAKVMEGAYDNGKALPVQSAEKRRPTESTPDWQKRGYASKQEWDEEQARIAEENFKRHGVGGHA